MKVVIVEDDETIAKLYSVILLRAGHVVWKADQHDLSTIGDPDVAIVDVMMPDVDGLAVLKALCTDHPRARRIVASAIYKIPDEVRALADVVLNKPFSGDQLLGALQ